MMRCLLALILAMPAAFAMDLSPLEKIPVQETGRKKPYLVFAEESALALTGRTKVTVDNRKIGAMELITTLWLNPEGWQDKQIILVNHKLLKDEIGLDASRKLYSYNELSANPKLLQLLKDAQAVRARPGNQRVTGLPKEASDVGLRLAEFEALTNGSAFRFVANPTLAEGQWSPAPAAAIAPLHDAFLAKDDGNFARAAAKFASDMAAIQPQFQPPDGKITLETIYQKSHPFRWAWICYAIAGVFLIFAGRKETTEFADRREEGPVSSPAYALAWVFAGGGFLLQIAGFAARTVISGRAPVTNMYESVVWVAFGTVFFALIFEAIYRSRYFLLGAVPVAVVSLILADTQTVALDRAINPLVPVLRDNFWLTTHVLSITLSYAAFLLALGIGHIILGRVIFGKKPSSTLYNYLYRVLQVGVLLLACGTILGGVWANYSWGRFWDWDPKETWALVTLLGYLFVLHGRIAGRWGGFGMAVGAVLCFLCVLMAWYGVNFVLGVGLHSYGFGSGGFGYALTFVIAELAFVALAFFRKGGNPSSKTATRKEEKVGVS